MMRLVSGLYNAIRSRFAGPRTIVGGLETLTDTIHYKVKGLQFMDAGCHQSPVFELCNHKWQIHIYPFGDPACVQSRQDWISIWVVSAEPGSSIKFECRLSMISSLSEIPPWDAEAFGPDTDQRKGRGCAMFASRDLALSQLYCQNGTLLIRLEMTRQVPAG